MTNWVARFGVPDIVTTDQGRQFESKLMRFLNTTFGIQHVRTSPYHPQTNGLVERFHRTLKAALTAHESPHWSQHLPIVLLALRNTVKPDVGATPAELVYGTSLRLPGELFHAAPQEARTPDFVTVLKASMARLRSAPGADHDSSRRISYPRNSAPSVTYLFESMHNARLSNRVTKVCTRCWNVETKTTSYSWVAGRRGSPWIGSSRRSSYGTIHSPTILMRCSPLVIHQLRK